MDEENFISNGNMALINQQKYETRECDLLEISLEVYCLSPESGETETPELPIYD